MLGGGAGVESVVAFVEIAADALTVLDGEWSMAELLALTVLDRVGVVVLELGLYAQHSQPSPTDA